MATVRAPAPDTRMAPHAGTPLGSEATGITPTAFHRIVTRASLHTSLGAAAPVDTGTAIVEQTAIGTPAAVSVGRGAGRGPVGGGPPRPKRYGCPGRPARSPHIV